MDQGDVYWRKGASFEKAGKLRVIANPVPFPEIAEEILGLVRHYGRFESIRRAFDPPALKIELPCSKQARSEVRPCWMRWPVSIVTN